jgi:hypothetical protein
VVDADITPLERAHGPDEWLLLIQVNAAKHCDDKLQKEKKGGADMRRKLIAVTSAAMLALTATALPQKAEARDGWWVAGAVVGGLALGVLAANAYYYNPYWYGYYPAYYGYYPAYGYYPYYHRHYYHRHYYAYYPYYHRHYHHHYRHHWH